MLLRYYLPDVLFLYSSTFKKFLSLPNHTVRVLVTRKGISRGAGYGLEISLEYVFNGIKRALQLTKKSLENIDSNINKKAGECLK